MEETGPLPGPWLKLRICQQEHEDDSNDILSDFHPAASLSSFQKFFSGRIDQDRDPFKEIMPIFSSEDLKSIDQIAQKLTVP